MNLGLVGLFSLIVVVLIDCCCSLWLLLFSLIVVLLFCIVALSSGRDQNLQPPFVSELGFSGSDLWNRASSPVWTGTEPPSDPLWLEASMSEHPSSSSSSSSFLLIPFLRAVCVRESLFHSVRVSQCKEITWDYKTPSVCNPHHSIPFRCLNTHTHTHTHT